jgi:5'-nucleotidase / UDP-sugar diphosphatase
MARRRALIVGVASWLLACEAPPGDRLREPVAGSLVLIHTSDLHSHLFPERQLMGAGDAARGLGPRGEVVEVGGFARVARVVAQIRAGAQRSLYLDSGDLVEGTAAFTEFGGEPELRAFSGLGLRAAALGNHDLAVGAEAFATTHRRFAEFPVLAANVAENGSELVSALERSVVLDAGGVTVGVIGVANNTSPSALALPDDLDGIEILPTASAVQSEIDRLRADVDVLVALSHLGLEGDQRLISSTTGLDVVLGGHQHLALDAAQEHMDCGAALEAKRGCCARRVFLAHSGALGRYVGELDLQLVAREAASTASVARGSVISSAAHFLIPVSAEVEEDAALAGLLEPYREWLKAAGFEEKLCFARTLIERYAADGADSALGNLVTDALRASTGADFALLNSSGIRADLPPGELTRASFAAALPFGDKLTMLTLSGAELRVLFNQQARVASGRTCQSPIQISGLRLELKCSGSSSSAVARSAGSGLELDSRRMYSLVTSAYLADGGSGFELPEGVPRRALNLDPLQLLLDAISGMPGCAESRLPCLDPGVLRDHRISMQRR